MTSNNIDFGFGGDEFEGETKIIPYCQFLNSSAKDFGIAITSTNAELAKFQLINSWQPIEHQFADRFMMNLLFNSNYEIVLFPFFPLFLPKAS